MSEDAVIRNWSEPVIYGLVAMLLWMVPVFDRLHVESAAVLSLIAFFVAGAAVIRRIRGAGKEGIQTGRWIRVTSARLGWLLLPAGLLAFSALWAPNCDWIRGGVLFAVFTVPTVIFSSGLAAFLTARTRRPLAWLTLAGITLAVLGPLFDIGLHPQFYTYSTVFGGVPGPIYDEDLVLRPGLFVHRVVTVAWGVFFFASRVRFTGWSLVLVLAIGGTYVFSGPLGLNTPIGYLRSTFDGHLRTEHFDIYYDPAVTDSLELVRIAEEHEFRYAQFDGVLGVTVDERISTFIYPDAETRARLTGARVTSVAPVWLRTPQIHVERTTFHEVFPHELVHVFSREFGLPILNASLYVGLVEGLAVALEPPDGGPSADEQVAAAAWASTRDTDGRFAVAGRMEEALSAAGFWGGRGAVSYTTSGSFVHFLLDSYGPEPLKYAYALGNFEEAYGVGLSVLTEKWEKRLESMPVMYRTAGPRALRRFSVPSLFERRCPHWVPPELRTLRRASGAARDGREQEALSLLTGLPDRVRRTTAVRLLEADLIVERNPEAALRLLGDSLITVSPDAAALAGDALALLGRVEAARHRYAFAISHESPDERTARVLRILRHALAQYPDAIRSTRTLRSDSVAASVVLDTMSASGRVAALFAEAIILYGDGRFEASLALLEAARSENIQLWPTAEVRRFSLRLEALAAYRANRIALSEAIARQALALYAEAGDLSMVAVMNDLLHRIEFRKMKHMTSAP